MLWRACCRLQVAVLLLKRTFPNPTCPPARLQALSLDMADMERGLTRVAAFLDGLRAQLAAAPHGGRGQPHQAGHQPAAAVAAAELAAGDGSGKGSAVAAAAAGGVGGASGGELAQQQQRLLATWSGMLTR